MIIPLYVYNNKQTHTYATAQLRDLKNSKPTIHVIIPNPQLTLDIDTIPYDTGLEAPFAHSLHTAYFRKFTPCLLPRLTFEPEPLRQVGKFRPTKLN